MQSQPDLDVAAKLREDALHFTRFHATLIDLNEDKFVGHLILLHLFNQSHFIALQQRNKERSE